MSDEQSRVGVNFVSVYRTDLPLEIQNKAIVL